MVKELQDEPKVLTSYKIIRLTHSLTTHISLYNLYICYHLYIYIN